jgi:pyruvate formate lyase activating enzyme
MKQQENSVGESAWQTAAHWRRLDEGRVRCELCPHHCVLREAQTGLCKVRTVRGGELRAAAYGLISAAHIDPIEKKPLYHFHPGSPIYSIGGWGCNFACRFCQNWGISQQVVESDRVVPDEMIERARASGCKLIAYTYNEPLVGFEYVRDCSLIARKAGLKNVLVTNGYIESAPAAELLPLIDALNVDIKSIEEDFYRQQCRGTLDPVLNFCRQAVAQGCHVEITNLLIPTLNDQPAAIERLAQWIARELGPRTPLHVSAYHPDYQTTIRPTTAGALESAFAMCKRHLLFVYLGNVFTDKGQNTLCPDCGQEWIKRSGYATQIRGMRGGVCVHCGRKADVVL